MNNTVVGAALTAIAVALFLGTEILAFGLLPILFLDEVLGLPDWAEYGLDAILALAVVAFSVRLALRAYRLERAAPPPAA